MLPFETAKGTRHMRTHLIIPFIAALLTAGATAVPGASGPPVHDPGLAQFQRAVQDYVSLHRTLEAEIPPPEISADPERFLRPVRALATAIQTARQGARPGDVFTETGGTLIRLRIRAALAQHGFDANELLREMLADGENAPSLRINHRFPWRAGTAMWPFMIAALPPLPAELEYRFVGRDLVLLDVHGNLVVDILPAALPT
jgi:hypothetical protein